MTFSTPTGQPGNRRCLPEFHTISRVIFAVLALLLTMQGASAQTYILNEDFSSATGTTPPTGWTNTATTGAGDRWTFDNPLNRPVNYPISGRFAMFDSEGLSGGGGPEVATLETKPFDASISQNTVIYFDHYFLGGRGGKGTVEAFNGTGWVNVRTYIDTTANPGSELIDISPMVGGVPNAKVRFRWEGDSSNYWAIDNIRILAPQSLDAGLTALPSPVMPFPPGVQPIKVRLANFGLNVLTSTTLNWSVNGVRQPAVAWAGSLPLGSTEDNIALGSFNFPQGFTANILVWQSLPNGQPDQNSLNDTLRARIYSSLCGTYTIGGASPDFATFSAAVNALNTAGIACPVVFKVRNGTYNERIRLNTITGSSKQNTVTFQSESHNYNLVTLRGTSTPTENYTLLLSGTKYISFRKIRIDHASGTNIALQNRNRNIAFDSCYLSCDNGQGVGNTVMAFDFDTAFSVTRSRVTGGIYIAANALQPARGIRIDGNTINNAGAFPATSYSSVHLVNTIGSYVQNNSISMGRLATYGIHLQQARSALLLRNNISGIPSTRVTGIWVEHGHTVIVRRNFLFSASSQMSGINISETDGLVYLFSNELIGSPTKPFFSGITAASSKSLLLQVDSNQISYTPTGISVGLKEADSVLVQRNVISSLPAGVHGINLYNVYPDSVSIRPRYAFVSCNRVLGMVTGIALNLGTNRVTAVNNLLQISGTARAVGIYNTGSQNNIYHNSVNARGNDPLLANAFEMPTGQGVKVLNNIFLNQGQSRAARLGFAPTDSGCVLDNNDYYTEGGVLAVMGGNNYTSLAAFRSATGQDRNSLNVNPFFTTDQEAWINQILLKGAAQPHLGGARDIDFFPRPFMPTIGACEHRGCAPDASLLALRGLVRPLPAGLHPLSATLINQQTAGGGLTTATLHWRVNGQAQPDVPWTGNLQPGDTALVLLGNVTFDPKTRYDIVAWVTDPNGLPDCKTRNDTTRRLDVWTALCGVYTVGSGGRDFRNFTEVASSLNNGGILCPVTFRVQNTRFFDQVQIQFVPGSSPANTITFEAETLGDSANCGLVYNASPNSTLYPLTLLGTRHIRFRHMSVTRDGFGGLLLASGNRDVLFTNCHLGTTTVVNLDSGLTMRNTFFLNTLSIQGLPKARGLLLENDSFPTGRVVIQTTRNVTLRSNRIQTALSSDGFVVNTCQDVRFANNRLRMISQNLYKCVSFVNGQNVWVENNLFNYSTLNSPCNALSLSNVGGQMVVRKNTFRGVTPISLMTSAITAVGQFEGAGRNIIRIDSNQIGRAIRGISLQLTTNDSVRVRGNRITGGLTEGIALADFNTGSDRVYTAAPPRWARISNNSITGMQGGTGISLQTFGIQADNNFIQMAGPGKLVGIYNSLPVSVMKFSPRANNRLYFNSVNLQGTDADGSRALQVESVTGLTARNNIFANTGLGYAGYLSASPRDSGAAMDYNDYFSSSGRVALLGNSTVTTLAALRAATGQEAHACSANPHFTPGQPNINQRALMTAGTPIAGITTDLVGQLRPTPPTIGAREYFACAPDAELVEFSGLQSPLTSGPQAIRVLLLNNSDTALTRAQLFWTVNGVLQQTVNWRDTLPAHRTAVVPLGSFDFAPGTEYTLKAWLDHGGSDCNAYNDTLRRNGLVTPLCGVYTIGGPSPDFPTLKAAVLILNNAGVSCPVTFRLRNGSYAEEIRIGRVQGASALNTVTFESEARDSLRVAITYQTVNSLLGPTITLSGASHIIFRHLRILRSPNGPAIFLEDRTRNITVSSCDIQSLMAVEVDSGLTVSKVLFNGIVSVSGTLQKPARGVLIDRMTTQTGAIQLRHAADAAVRNCNVNSINSQAEAIAVRNSTSVLLDGNRILNRFAFGSQGFVVDSVQQVRLRLNYVQTNNQAQGGIRVSNCGKVRIDHNTLEGIPVQFMDLAVYSTGNRYALVDSNQVFQGITGIGGYFQTSGDTLIASGNTFRSMTAVGITLDRNPDALPTPGFTAIQHNRILNILDGFGVVVNVPGTLTANNFIQGTSSRSGIWIRSPFNRVVYNSVSMTGTDGANSSAFMSQATDNIQLKNNIFANMGAGFATILAAPPLQSDWDYNNYHAQSGNLGLVGFSGYTSLPAWKSALRIDPNSQSLDPFYLSQLNLRPQQRFLNGAGIPVPSVGLDIDGELRSGSAPDVGADEFSVDFGVTELLKPTQSCNLGPNDSVMVNVNQFGDVPLKELKIAYQVNGGPVHTDTVKGSTQNDIKFLFRQRQDLSVAGVYRFKIWLVNINDDNINNDTLRIERIKAPTPTVDYTFLTACANQAVSFQGTASVSPGSIVKYEWHFGDGDTASGQNVSHLYALSDTYPVALRAYTNEGCYGEMKKSVIVRATPKTEFTAADGCQGVELVFQNRSLPNGSTPQYTWKFGDGNTEINTNTRHIYMQPGTYTVWLVGRGNTGCLDSVSHPVTIYPTPTVEVTPRDTVAIIPGGNATLTATPGFPVYAWSNGQRFQEIVVNTPGLYGVVVRDAHQCQGFSNQVLVIRLAPLEITLGRDTTFCLGRSYTIGVPGTYLHYRWSTGDTTPTITVDTSGVYSLTVTGKFGLTATDHILVTFQPLRNVAFTGLQPEYCQGATAVVLTGTPAGGVFSGPGTLGNIFSPSQAGPGQHTVKYLYTNAEGCSGFEEHEVWVRDTAAPAVTASGPLAFCAGDSVTLTSANPVGNVWSTGDTTVSITVRTSATVTVRARRGGCLSKLSQAFVVVVRPVPDVPVITASGPLTFCQGDSVTLTSSTGRNTLWSNGAAGSFIRVGETGTYRAVTASLGCTSDSTAPIHISVNTPPNVPLITLAGSTTLCQGESVWLVAASFSDTITWNTGVRNDSLLVAQPGTYYATASYATGCTSDTSRHVRIVVNPAPATPAITASRPLTFCQGDSVVLYARNAAPPDTVVWSTGHRGDSIVVRQSGQYSVNTVNRFGCQGGISGPVLVTATAQPFLQAIGNDLLCGLDSTLLRMQTGLTTNLETFWLDGQGNVLTTGHSLWYKANNVEGVDQERVFIAKVNVMGLNCASYDTVRIRIRPSPLARAGRDTGLCQGEWAVLGESASPVHQYQYEWSPREHLDANTLPQPRVTNDLQRPLRQVYRLRKYNPITGCQAFDSVVVNFNAPVFADIAGPDQEICSGTTAALEGLGSDIPEHRARWTPSLWLADSGNLTTAIAPVLADGAPAERVVYYLRRYHMNSHCPIAEDSTVVTVHSRYERRPDGSPYCEEAPVEIPNILTPNDDSKNEAFHVQGLEYYPQSRFRVFNRWGKEVYSASPYRNDWKPAEAGLFFYRLELMGGKKSFSGWVEVVK